MAEEKFLTVSEMVDYTGRSRAWLLKDENKEALINGGAELGGRGQGSKIPQSLIDSLGWVKETVVTDSTNSEQKALEQEIADLEAELAKAKEVVANGGAVIKEKKAELSKLVKAEQRERAKEQTKLRREKEKALAKAREEFERLRNEVEELSA